MRVLTSRAAGRVCSVRMPTLAVSAAAGLVFGLLPAVQAGRLDVAAGLRQGGRSLAGRADSRRFRSVLTIGEMALAMLLH